MTDFAITIFRLVNRRGFFAPPLNIEYLEDDTGALWVITCAGTRAYFVRYNDQLDRKLTEQTADSHFMARRLITSLLLGGAGLFQAEVSGRLMFEDIEGSPRWHSDLEPPQSQEYTLSAADWFTAITQHTPLRRAGDDAHAALSMPSEAFVFIYRGFEWLVKGVGLSWAELARRLQIPASEFKKLKKLANYESGIRHASLSGVKMRPNLDNYGTWVAGLFEAINVARAELDSDFQPMTAGEIAQAIARAAPRPFD